MGIRLSKRSSGTTSSLVNKTLSISEVPEESSFQTYSTIGPYQSVSYAVEKATTQKETTEKGNESPVQQRKIEKLETLSEDLGNEEEHVVILLSKTSAQHYQKPREIGEERLKVLIRDLRNEDVHVAILYSKKSTQHRQKARAIADYVISKHIRVSLIDFEENWVQCAKTEYITHHIFVGIPVMKRPKQRETVRLGLTPEEEYMEKGSRKLSQVVVIQPNMPAAPRTDGFQGHYLERFLQLNYREDPVWLRLP